LEENSELASMGHGHSTAGNVEIELQPRQGLLR